ncbi:CCAAT/enhancer-binding protein delta [Suncus etruscus]|uniref:CCAAT/enhancer-binding protein delta n=1 Tax=Suncus etruscus TaxID=109475 RepID=UPI00210F364F|nr:CCAAT/enhancer-binding protein delta [Suncus etruscus]
MSAALFSLDGAAEPAAWLEPGGRAGKGLGPEPAGAVDEFESAVDLSAYIDAMAGVPTLELCHDELFADLFHSSQREPRPLKPEPDWGGPDGDGHGDAAGPGSLLPAQVAACAQTVVSLAAAAAQPTPPASPAPPRASPAPGPAPAPAPAPARERAAAGKRGPERGSPEYRQRRERNNLAVRKSRDKAKRRHQEMQRRLVELAAENEALQRRVEQLTRDLAGLRRFFERLPGAPERRYWGGGGSRAGPASERECADPPCLRAGTDGGTRLAAAFFYRFLTPVFVRIKQHLSHPCPCLSWRVRRALRPGGGPEKPAPPGELGSWGEAHGLGGGAGRGGPPSQPEPEPGWGKEVSRGPPKRVRFPPGLCFRFLASLDNFGVPHDNGAKSVPKFPQTGLFCW